MQFMTRAEEAEKKVQELRSDVSIFKKFYLFVGNITKVVQ